MSGNGKREDRGDPVSRASVKLVNGTRKMIREKRRLPRLFVILYGTWLGSTSWRNTHATLLVLVYPAQSSQQLVGRKDGLYLNDFIDKKQLRHSFTLCATQARCYYVGNKS